MLTLRQLSFTLLVYSISVTGILLMIFMEKGRHKLYYEYKTNAIFMRRNDLNGRGNEMEMDIQIGRIMAQPNFEDSRLNSNHTISKTNNNNVQTPMSTITKKHSHLKRVNDLQKPVINKLSIYRMHASKVKGFDPMPFKPITGIDCPDYSPMLKGAIKVNASYVPTESEAIKAAGFSVHDGCYEPPQCVPTQTVAIIVPYKNRQQHLITLMHHLHPVLQRQWSRYCIFVTEQYDDGAFNKARVMNAAFLEIEKNSEFKFNCVIFHDVDMLVEDDRNLHRCSAYPRHLSPALDKFNYKTNYGTHFGGVGAVSVQLYKRVNGHSNRFWGWGGEDSDIETRFKIHDLNIWWNEQYGRYKMIPHVHPWYFNPLSGIGSFKLKSDTKKYDTPTKFMFVTDPSGLNSIRYSVVNRKTHKLFRKFTIDIRTILLDKAYLFFDDHDSKLEVENPWFTNQRYDKAKNKKKEIRGFGIEAVKEFPNTDCEFRKYDQKTVNMTMGIKEPQIYNKTYTDLMEAKKECTRLARYCLSIVEVEPGNYKLRSTAFMHEKVLHYKLGRYPQTIIEEVHQGVAVYVKICQGDARFLQFLDKPIILSGESDKDPYPTYQMELDLQIYRIENVSLNYTTTIYTAHKAILKDMEGVMNKSLSHYDSLSVSYHDSIFLLNLTNATSVQPFLPIEFETLEDFMSKGHSVLRIRPPPLKLPKIPGSFVCDSMITDQTGSPLLSWKWWYEMRGETPQVEKALMNELLQSGEVGTTEFTEGITRHLLRSLQLPGEMSLPDAIMMTFLEQFNKDPDSFLKRPKQT